MKKFLLCLLLLIPATSAAQVELVRAKNAATHIVVAIRDSATGALVSGATGLDSEIDQYADGAAPNGFTDCTNEATEIGSTGLYYLTLTSSEMNSDLIALQVKTSTSGAIGPVVSISTLSRTASLSTQGKADVNAEVLDVLDTDTNAELSALPGSTPTIKQMLQYVYQYSRNKLTSTSTTQTLYKNDGSTSLGASTLSDNGTTFTKGRLD